MEVRVMSLKEGAEVFGKWSLRLQEEEDRNKDKAESPEEKIPVFLSEAPPGTPLEETCCRPKCPKCGNNDTWEGSSIQLVTRWMSSALDLRCLACGKDSLKWRYFPGKENCVRVRKDEIH